MLLAEVNNPSGLRLTKSDTDGIFLHFDTGEKQAGLRLDTLRDCSSVILLWAESQFRETTTNKPRLSASEFTKRIRTQPYNPKWAHTLIIQTEDRDELCYRLDRAEAINKIKDKRIAEFEAMVKAGGECCDILQKRINILEGNAKAKKEQIPPPEGG